MKKEQMRAKIDKLERLSKYQNVIILDLMNLIDVTTKENSSEVRLQWAASKNIVINNLIENN